MRANHDCDGHLEPGGWRLQLTDGPDDTVVVVATLRLDAPSVFVCRITGFARSEANVDKLDLFGNLGFSVVARELADPEFALSAFDQLREQLTELLAGERPPPRCASKRAGLRRPRR